MSHRTQVHKSIPRRTCTPGDEWVWKGCDKLALWGNAKQRFWQHATWNPCKTTTCIVSLLYSTHLGGKREERKAGCHVNTVNTRWVMSWKSWPCFAACTTTSSFTSLFVHAGDDRSQIQLLFACSIGLCANNACTIMPAGVCSQI